MCGCVGVWVYVCVWVCVCVNVCVCVCVCVFVCVLQVGRNWFDLQRYYFRDDVDVRVRNRPDE